MSKRTGKSTNLKIGDSVEVLRDIVRRDIMGRDIPYVSEGTNGTIVGIFNSGSLHDYLTHVQVKISDGSIKTLRLTSIKRI